MQYLSLPVIDPIAFTAMITSHNPQSVLDEIVAILTPIAVANWRTNDNHIMTFERGSAMLWATDASLFIEVEACDIVVCHGLQTTIGGLLAGMIAELPPALLWVPKKASGR